MMSLFIQIIYHSNLKENNIGQYKQKFMIREIFGSLDITKALFDNQEFDQITNRNNYGKIVKKHEFYNIYLFKEFVHSLW